MSIQKTTTKSNPILNNCGRFGKPTFFPIIGWTLVNPKWERIINRYEEWHIPSTAIIAFTSGLAIEFVCFLFTYSSINWSVGKAMMLSLIYLMVGLMGLLSHIKFQDYKKEKDLGRR